MYKVKIESIEWQGRHEGSHVIPSMEKISTNEEVPFVNL